MTANNVIASAKRLIEFRHDCFSSNRMAEISVPAWPIPIHQTKLTIAKPQPTGMLMPQMPTPLNNRYAAASPNTPARPPDSASNASHPSETSRFSTIELILSVIVPNVCPGATTGIGDRFSSCVFIRNDAPVRRPEFLDSRSTRPPYELFVVAYSNLQAHHTCAD